MVLGSFQTKTGACAPSLGSTLKPHALMNHSTVDGYSREVGSFRKLGVPYLGVLIIRILLFRVLYRGPIFSETLKWQSYKPLNCDVGSCIRPKVLAGRPYLLQDRPIPCYEGGVHDDATTPV